MTKYLPLLFICLHLLVTVLSFYSLFFSLAYKSVFWVFLHLYCPITLAAFVCVCEQSLYYTLYSFLMVALCFNLIKNNFGIIIFIGDVICFGS